jgi:hypothetical protein
MTFTDIDQQFIRVILAIMANHIGRENRISRGQLLVKVRWYYPTAYDRQIREALAQTPVISSSGSGGYWLPANREEVEAYLSELSSRQARIAERKRIISEWMIQKSEPIVHQPALLEVNQ